MDIRTFDVWEPRYTTKEVCAAAGIKYDTMKTWFQRDLILGEDDTDDRENKTHGAERRLSFGRAMQIAIMGHFCALGIPASKASRIALAFTDLGEGGAAWGNAPVALKRLPGRLYKNGLTMIAGYADEEFGHVFNIENSSDPTFYQKLFHPQGMKSNHQAVVGVMGLDITFVRLFNALEVKAHRVSEGE